jgi:hypothetical protein
MDHGTLVFRLEGGNQIDVGEGEEDDLCWKDRDPSWVLLVQVDLFPWVDTFLDQHLLTLMLSVLDSYPSHPSVGTSMNSREN